MLFSTLKKKLILKNAPSNFRGGGGGGNIVLAFYAIPTFLEKINSGNKKLNIFFL